MDDQTQNKTVTSQPQADGSVVQADATQTPIQQPVDPMANVQVPDLSAAPVVATPITDQVAMPAEQPATPSSADQAGQAMEQMATGPMPVVIPEPQPQAESSWSQPTAPMASVDEPVAPAADQVSMQPSSDVSQLGPVTMEDLMEELQHIEDKLDEMDEKL